MKITHSADRRPKRKRRIYAARIEDEVLDILERNLASQNDRAPLRGKQYRIQTREGQSSSRRTAGDSIYADQRKFGYATLEGRNCRIACQLQTLELEDRDVIGINPGFVRTIKSTEGVERTSGVEEPDRARAIQSRTAIDGAVIGYAIGRDRGISRNLGRGFDQVWTR